MVGAGPSLGRGEESAAHALMSGVLRDDQRRQPGNVAFHMYRGERVGRSYPDDPALQLCDTGYSVTPLREASQAARKISSVGWIPELPKEAGQGRCVALHGFANDH